MSLVLIAIVSDFALRSALISTCSFSRVHGFIHRALRCEGSGDDCGVWKERSNICAPEASLRRANGLRGEKSMLSVCLVSTLDITGNDDRCSDSRGSTWSIGDASPATSLGILQPFSDEIRAVLVHWAAVLASSLREMI